eukprot:m.99377 g.99377  ORF g.99377 m.99377 type:complete len:221 (-) comp15589_c0_seq4:984-1646(-)
MAGAEAAGAEQTPSLWECHLQCCADERQYRLLVDRANALFDGAPSAARPFRFVEQIYHHPNATLTNGPVTLRVRHTPETKQWSLVYYGPVSETEKTLLRKVTICHTSSNVQQLVEALGFSLQEELVRAGVMFTYKRTTELSIARLYKVSSAPDSSGGAGNQTLLSPDFFVELGSICPEAQVKDASRDLDALAKELQPIVVFEKVSTRTAGAKRAAGMGRR